MTADPRSDPATLVRHALAEGDAAWRILVDENPLPVIVVCDRTQVVLVANAAAEALYGYPAGALAGEPAGALAALGGDAIWTGAAERAGRRTHVGVPHRRRDGTALLVDLATHELRVAGGAAHLAVITDVSDRASVQAQLRQAQKMGAIGQLASSVAHDFNNLLTAMITATQLAEEAVGAEHAAREDLAVIARAARRAAELTGQLLAVSRKRAPKPEVLDLNVLIVEPVQLLRRLVGQRVELRLATAPLLWPVRADAGQVEQVLLNLVVNARDAMPEGGTLTISTGNRIVCDPPPARLPGLPAGEYAALAVQDTGVGMDGDTLRRVFEPFFTTKPAGRGTGLGLSTVYGIAKQWGGYVYGESVPGRGSAFSMLLPRAT